MKSLGILPALLFSIFLISSSFAQQNDMMKNDSMMTAKNNMKKEMKSTNTMMKQNTDMNKEKMKSNNMMKKEMMVKIDKDKNDVAINGYDPVAYFTDNKSEMGKKEFSYKWNGAKWYFANKDHMEMFEKNPEKYEPEYGGFCAFGVTKDKLVSSDPNAWQIVDGKLYLCHTKEIHKLWKKDIKKNIEKGNKMFPKLNSNM